MRIFFVRTCCRIRLPDEQVEKLFGQPEPNFRRFESGTYYTNINKQTTNKQNQIKTNQYGTQLLYCILPFYLAPLVFVPH
jgi:hypothetical protein